MSFKKTTDLMRAKKKVQQKFFTLQSLMRSQSKVYLSYIRYPSFTVWTKIEFTEASNALIKDDRNTQCQTCSKISSIKFSLRIQTKSSRNKNLQCCYSYHNHKRTKKQSFQNTIFRALKLRWYSLTKWYNFHNNHFLTVQDFNTTQEKVDIQ